MLPIFKEYGTYFKTHRIFRQYLFALIVPPVLFTDYQNWSALGKTESLWATHSRRLNAKYGYLYEKNNFGSKGFVLSKERVAG